VSATCRLHRRVPTLKLNEEAARLKDKGEAVVHLGAGEPKNKAPINAILSAAASSIQATSSTLPLTGFHP